MDLARKIVDLSYDIIKPFVFRATRDDPQCAHELFIDFCNKIYDKDLDQFLLDNEANDRDPGFEISNAAGQNKDAEIPPAVMKYMGFDRVVIGTVTHDAWPGNPRPNIRRYHKSESLVNWQGLPGDGAEIVAARLASYGTYGIPTTVNIMSTPQKEGDEMLKDIENTIRTFSDNSGVDRLEMNISCPNTHHQGKMDARSEYEAMLDSILSVTDQSEKEIWLKVSPDLEERGVESICTTGESHNVTGVVCTNTSSNHGPSYIDPSPGKGGASGNAVYGDSYRVQMLFEKKIEEAGLDWKVIACGGLNSVERVQRRTKKAVGIQIYTPFIFNGPRFLRELRQM